ncbi:MAG TPA: response regulator transcription factor [Burkholderiales bacterium]|jgi:DNA-binding NarL/FixJ family response regulator|nr:response regulator transcription factor [Burkholderiales bacterium]
MYRVFLVEDSAVVRQRVLELLGSIDGVNTIGSATTANDAERAILQAQPDAVLLDIKLAQGSGFDVLRSLRKQAPHIEIYMLSNFTAQPYRERAASLGARGFFDKTNEIERLRQTMAARAAQSTH